MYSQNYFIRMDFNIIEDKGNYKHWEYTAEYTEFLSNFPSIKNKAVGKFIVKPEGKEYAIYSTHNTCFFNAYCCKSTILSCSKLLLILHCYFLIVKSTSEFRFSSTSQSKTVCKESISFQCPYFLAKLCTSEVMYQRATIRNNLIDFFNHHGRVWKFFKR